MNAKEVATLLGLHPNTIYTMIREGNIKADKKGRSFDIPDWQVKELQEEKAMLDSNDEKKTMLLKVIVDFERDLEGQLQNFYELTRMFQLDMKDKEIGSLSIEQARDKIVTEYKNENHFFLESLEAAKRIFELKTTLELMKRKYKILEEVTPIEEIRWELSDDEVNDEES